MIHALINFHFEQAIKFFPIIGLLIDSIIATIISFRRTKLIDWTIWMWAIYKSKFKFTCRLVQRYLDHTNPWEILQSQNVALSGPLKLSIGTCFRHHEGLPLQAFPWKTFNAKSKWKIYKNYIKTSDACINLFSKLIIPFVLTLKNGDVQVTALSPDGYRNFFEPCLLKFIGFWLTTVVTRCWEHPVVDKRCQSEASRLC